MGTTKTAMDAGGLQAAFTLIIEGYDQIITDWTSMSAVVTAYAATDWSSAIGGLKVLGSIEQAIRPWSDEIDIPTLRFVISDWDGADTFGTAIWKAEPTQKTRLTALYDAATGEVWAGHALP